MAVEMIPDVGQTLPSPTGRVLGVVDTRATLDEVATALKKAGFDKVTAIHGVDGVELLERFEGAFWGDAEGPILKRHLQELKAGNGIFAVQTPSDRADEAAEIASQHGARFLVHFGYLVVTWLKK